MNSPLTTQDYKDAFEAAETAAAALIAPLCYTAGPNTRQAILDSLKPLRTVFMDALASRPDTLARPDREAEYKEAETLALRAIHDTDGRGMIGRERRFLHYRVARAILQARRDALALLPPADGWRSIEDDPPPKDGSWIVVTSTWNQYYRASLQWSDDGWWDLNEHLHDLESATHWMPLPAPPAAVGDE